MEALLAVIVGILWATGIYLLFQRALIRVVVGVILLSHGANLLVLTMGRLKRGLPPVLEPGMPATAYTDPLPQALVLTAIVISFAMTAYLLVLAYRAYQANGSDDLWQLRGDSGE